MSLATKVAAELDDHGYAAQDVTAIRKSAPAFYSEYKTARKVLNQPGGEISSPALRVTPEVKKGRKQSYFQNPCSRRREEADSRTSDGPTSASSPRRLLSSWCRGSNSLVGGVLVTSAAAI